MGDFLAGPVGSWLRVFLSAILVAVLADLTELGDIDFTDWRTYLIAGVSAVLPVVIAYLNASDPRFGNVSNVPDPVSPPTND